MSLRYFGTDGIRGVALRSPLTLEEVSRWGAAWARVAREAGVKIVQIIGYKDGDYTPREWEKTHVQNYTGSTLAYRPDGSLLNKGERPKVTGDYDAWSPE